MKVNNEEFIALCATHGIEGIDIVNELMRFKVLDQLISSNASSREWGVTADDLYALAEKSTVESFGPVPYGLNTFQALYGPSFRVELFDFIRVFICPFYNGYAIFCILIKSNIFQFTNIFQAIYVKMI